MPLYVVTATRHVYMLQTATLEVEAENADIAKRMTEETEYFGGLNWYTETRDSNEPVEFNAVETEEMKG